MSAETLRKAAAQVTESAGNAFGIAVGHALAEAADAWEVLSGPGVIGDPSADPLLASHVDLALVILGGAS